MERVIIFNAFCNNKQYFFRRINLWCLFIKTTIDHNIKIGLSFAANVLCVYWNVTTDIYNVTIEVSL